MEDKDQNLIDVGIEEGNQIFFKILDEYPILDENDGRRLSVLLSLMTNCIVQLHLNGYSERMLIDEVFHWCEVARDLMDSDDDEDEDDD